MRSQSDVVLDTENPALLRSELSDKTKEITSLQQELARVKKDKNITSGLVTQMQRDMTSKVRTEHLESLILYHLESFTYTLVVTISAPC